MVSYVQSLLANFFQLTTALQHGRHKKKISFFLFPAPLGQICFVLVLISPNHKARNRYPEMVTARTVEDLGCQDNKFLGDYWRGNRISSENCRRNLSRFMR